MAITNVAWARRVGPILCACGLLALAGCGGRFKLLPVSGKVTVDGEPLNHFRLSLVPDVAKGNTTPVACGARIIQGQYDVRTLAVKASDGGPGIPLGWYKVVVVILPGDPAPNFETSCTDVNKTPLAIEVVQKPEPGHYDLKLARAKTASKPKAPVSPRRKQERDEQKPGGA